MLLSDRGKLRTKISTFLACDTNDITLSGGEGKVHLEMKKTFIVSKLKEQKLKQDNHFENSSDNFTLSANLGIRRLYSLQRGENLPL